MAPSVALPDALVTRLAPAVAAQRELATEAVHAVLDPSIIRSAQVAVRANGNEYRAGMRRVLEHVGLDPDRAERQGVQAPPSPPVSSDRRCACESCSGEECAGSGDDDHYNCDDHDCEECYSGHIAYGCCGWCPECESHQGDGRDDVCDQGHCHDCEHVCDNC